MPEPELTQAERDQVRERIPENWPTTPEGWCDYWHILDSKWATNRASPLHHDNKCKLH